METKLQQLLDCQKAKGKNSCFNCDKFFTCKLRAVYIDLGMGNNGGFEF